VAENSVRGVASRQLSIFISLATAEVHTIVSKVVTEILDDHQGKMEAVIIPKKKVDFLRAQFSAAAIADDERAKEVAEKMQPLIEEYMSSSLSYAYSYFVSAVRLSSLLTRLMDAINVKAKNNKSRHYCEFQETVARIVREWETTDERLREVVSKKREKPLSESSSASEGDDGRKEGDVDLPSDGV